MDVSGPLFDGRAAHELAKAEEHVADRAAARVEDMIRDRVRFLADHGTGRYERGLMTFRQSRTSRLISDAAVTYGAWLEGTSHRNETTAFKGWSAMRGTAEKVSASNMIGDMLKTELVKRGVTG